MIPVIFFSSDKYICKDVTVTPCSMHLHSVNIADGPFTKENVINKDYKKPKCIITIQYIPEITEPKQEIVKKHHVHSVVKPHTKLH